MSWLKLVSRPYYWLTQQLSALWYWRQRRSAFVEMEKYRALLARPEDLQHLMQELGFAWRQDPKVLGVTMEWARAPWVTWLRRNGDCEDLTLLAEHMLRGIVHNPTRYALRSTEGNWHAVLLFSLHSGWGLWSNKSFVRFTTKEEALRYFYGARHDKALEI